MCLADCLCKVQAAPRVREVEPLFSSRPHSDKIPPLDLDTFCVASGAGKVKASS